MVFSNITNTVTGQRSTLSKVAGALKLKAKKPARPRIVVHLPHIVADAASRPIPPTTKSKSKPKAKKSSASRPCILVQLPHIVGEAPTLILSTAERVLQWQPPKRHGDVLVDGILSPIDKEYLTQHGHYDGTGSWRKGKYESSSSSSNSLYNSDDDYIPYVPLPVAPSLAPANLKRKRSMEDFSRRVMVVPKGNMKAFLDDKGTILYNLFEDTDGDYDF